MDVRHRQWRRIDLQGHHARPEQPGRQPGLEKTAERRGLRTLDDVKIIEGAKHPFMEVTTMLLPSEQANSINQRLMDSEKD